MNFYCNDISNGKLFLAVEFLSYLNGFDPKVIISCPQKDLDNYRGLAALFPTLIFTEEKARKYDLIFTDTISQEEDAALIYPILPVNEKLPPLPSGCIPPDTSKNIGSRYLPDLPSAQDMAERQITKRDLQGTKIIISAGPTAEDIDPVRYLTNRSSGKMGIALARAAFIRGAETELVLGPGSQKPPLVLNTTFVRSAAEMAEAVLEKFAGADVYIGSAALADYTPQQTESDKIKKKKGGLQIKLKRTTDVLQALSKKRKKQILVGFSVETNNVIANSLKKLEQKQLDMIVINNPKEQGSAFAVDTNKVSVLLKNGQMYNLSLQSKRNLSHKILDFLREMQSANA